jgi:pSer/pThr/pTyr-binding forkhead associated (FHA) protein
MKLNIKVGNADPRTIELKSKEALIGRGKSNHIIINHNQVSRQHLKVAYDQDHFFIEDLGSQNGTYIQDKRLKPKEKVLLVPGTIVRLNQEVIIKFEEIENTEFDQDHSLNIIAAPIEALAQKSITPIPQEGKQEQEVAINNYQEKFGEKQYRELYKMFNTKLKQQLSGMEGLRIKVLMMSSAATFLGIFIFLYMERFDKENPIDVFPDAFNKHIDHYILLYALIVIPSFLYCLIGSLLYNRQYRNLYKNKIVKEVFQLIDKDWFYNPEGRMYQAYLSSNLFTKKADFIEGDDFVKGKIDKTEFQFSELHTKYVTKDSKGRERKHTIFKGLFFEIDFNKHFNYPTYVFPDTAQKLFGDYLGKVLQSIGSEIIPDHGKLISLENPVFEKIYSVYSEDQVTARYILTPKIMHALVRLEKKVKRKIRLAFKDSNIYMAISFRENLFEPRILSSGVRFDDIKKIFELLGIVVLVIHEMQLNDRIWTKT